MRPFSSRHAFTLIELLVVIAIIAVVAAILFPVFARAREKAKAAACVSNLKQIGMALTLYADDHDDLLPRATSLLRASPSLPSALPNVMRPYVASTAVFQCPADVRNSRYAPASLPNFWPDVLWKSLGSSYAYNSEDPSNVRPRAEWPNHLWQTWRGGRRRTEFHQPAETGLASDTNPWHLVRDYDMTKADSIAQAAFNVVYLDGHVRQVFFPQQSAAMGAFPKP